MKCRNCGCTDEKPCLVDHAGNRGTTQILTFGPTSTWDKPTSRRVVSFADDEAIADADLENLELTPCSWIEVDLCSACVEAPAPAPLLYGADGLPLRGAP